MNKKNKILLSLISFILIFSLMIGCSGSKETLTSVDEEFVFSYGIDKDGLWDGIKAIKNVDLCEYTEISVPTEIHEVSDEAVQAEIDSMLTSFEEEIQITDRPLVDGDIVNIDYIGSVDGVEFAGGNTQEAGTVVTIGVTSYIDDFLEQLIGHSPGESFDIEVTFPDEYNTEELSGKDAVFAITINHIIEMVTPELTDAFVAENLYEVYGWETISAMKNYVKKNIQNSAIEYFIQDYIVANSTVNTLPQILVEYQEYSMIQYYKDYAAYYDMEYEEFLSAAVGVTTTEELLETNLGQNTGTAELYLLMQAVAEDADLSVTEDEAIEYFSGLSQTGTHTEYLNIYGMNHLKLITLQRKVLDYIKATVVLD